MYFYMVQCIKLLSYIMSILKYLGILIYVKITNITSLKHFSNKSATLIHFNCSTDERLGQICT